MSEKKELAGWSTGPSRAAVLRSARRSSHPPSRNAPKPSRLPRAKPPLVAPPTPENVIWSARVWTNWSGQVPTRHPMFWCKYLCLVIVSGITGKSVFCILDGFAHPLVPVFGPVLVRRYFSELDRFCIRSPIVPWVPPGYTFPSMRRTSLTGSERRTTQRFSMRLPLTVRWTTGAAVGETSTESRDVSSRGVYFFLSKDVREGSPVEILLTLPNEITLAGPVRVRCLGRVQRTEPREEGAVGVVAAIERYEFLRGEEEK